MGAAALAVAAVGGGAVFTATGQAAAPADAALGLPFALNANGDSFGSSLGLSPTQFPDLIEAYGDDGTRGYVRSTDLLGPDLSLDDVLRLPSVNGSRTTAAHQIPLYSLDGRTVIGTYTVY